MTLTFLAPLFLWGLLALPVIVVLHFLRTRRRRREVAGLFLWRQARQEAETRRRFSPSWLLLLQLLFAAAASLALSRPLLALEGRPDLVLVVDASASMAAQEADGTRLEQAVRVAESLLAEGGRVGLVRAGLDARVVVPLTDERLAVRRALASLRAGDREADLERGLALARSLAPEGEVHLISDAEPPAGDFAYHPVGSQAENVGIVALDPGVGRVYLALASSFRRPQTVPVELRRDGQLIAADSLLVPPGEQVAASFPLEAEGGVIEARLQPPAGDALALDDLAFAGADTLTIALEAPSEPLERALAAVPGVDYRIAGEVAEGAADARVLFGEAGGVTGNALVFAERSADPEFLPIRDWDQGDPLLRFVDLRDAVVGVDPAGGLEDEPEWEVLARAPDLTPLLRRRASEEGTVVQAAFHPSQSDLVFRPAFPMLIANVVDSFRGRFQVPLGTLVPGGATLDGREVDALLVPGVYRSAGSEVAAGLLSAAETRLSAPAAEPRAAPELSGSPRGRELFPWLTALALAALLAEWLVWSRARGGWVRGAA